VRLRAPLPTRAAAVQAACIPCGAVRLIPPGEIPVCACGAATWATPPELRAKARPFDPPVEVCR
jgi:hypothetical protein